MPQRDLVHHYSGPITFYRAPQCAPEEVPKDGVGIVGIPLDSWTLGRNGQRMGPRAIRESSLYLAAYYGLQVPLDEGFINVTDGTVSTVPAEPRLFDTGDVRLHQGDVEAQTRAIANHVRKVTEQGAMPVMLGGDHYIPYPSLLGFIEGMQQVKEDFKVGFLNMDGHFDLWDEFREMGTHNHGTFARRISEHPAVGKMAWWGLNGTHIIEPQQFDLCREKGYVGYTVDSIRRRGIQQTMREALDIVSEGVDAVYVTFDIDTVDGAYAPGTHSIVVDGLTANEVFEAVAILPEYESVQAFDVAEMLPQYDVGGGRTARLSAHVILSVIGDRILDSKSTYSQEELAQVFR